MSDIEGSPRHRSRSASQRRDDRNGEYSHSRSKSRSVSKERRSYYSRSRSRSRGARRYSRSYSHSPAYRRRSSKHYSGSRSRSRSRSPLSRRRRHVGSRDHPKTSRCVGVFGLSLYTTERELKDIFSRYGPIEDINLVHDHQTGRSRGFAFLYYRSLDDAVEAKERAPGTEIDGHKIRVDYSITERAHTPTPGVYLGRPTRGYRSERYSRRSPSPYYSASSSSRRPNRYSRSRSRERERSYDRYDRYERDRDRAYYRY